MFEINEILNEYNDIFATSKFDIGRVNIEPQRVILTSDMPISLRPYRVSPKQEQVVQEYNNTPHSVTKFPPAYLMFGIMPYPSPLTNHEYYPQVEEARKIAFNRTIEHHAKNKTRYDARFVKSEFKPGDKVKYEEFHYPNTRKLSPPFSGPYTIIKQLSEVNYEIDRPNALTKKDTEIVHASKLRYFFPHNELKLSHE